jgi:2-polyprenyl-3-methyl-5-hydroxy-6-metoxy-1,4-benzoquinol methylase
MRWGRGRAACAGYGTPRSNDLSLPTPQPWWPESWQESYLYDRIELGSPQWREIGYRLAYDERRRAALDMVLNACPPPGRVLDCAAGQGNMSIALSSAGYEVVWNDIREDLVDYVRLKEGTSRLEFRPGNVIELEPDSSFDVVVALEVIEHVAHPDLFLSHLARFMKDDGVLILTTPNGRYLRHNVPRFSECEDPNMYEGTQFGPGAKDHIFLLDRREIGDLAAMAGLEIVSAAVSGNPLTSGHMKLWLLHTVIPRTAIRLLDRVTRHLPFSQALHANLAVSLRRARGS